VHPLEREPGPRGKEEETCTGVTKLKREKSRDYSRKGYAYHQSIFGEIEVSRGGRIRRRETTNQNNFLYKKRRCINTTSPND